MHRPSNAAGVGPRAARMGGVSRIYLDHNATTPVAGACVDAMAAVLREDFGNPSSVHHFGQRAKALMDEARTAVARLLNADPSEVVFTGSGTEGDNLALRGAADVLEQTGRKHLVTSGIEHEAVLNTAKALARRGWEVTLVPVAASGIVSPDAVREAVTARTGIVSVMHANNEVGTVQRVAEIAAIAKAAGALVHVDAVQSAGKIPLDVKALGADLVASRRTSSMDRRAWAHFGSAAASVWWRPPPADGTSAAVGQAPRTWPASSASGSPPPWLSSTARPRRSGWPRCAIAWRRASWPPSRERP